MLDPLSPLWETCLQFQVSDLDLGQTWLLWALGEIQLMKAWVCTFSTKWEFNSVCVSVCFVVVCMLARMKGKDTVIHPLLIGM